MFFDDWQDILRIIAVGVPAYAGLIFMLRVSGKRTLSKMNAFDFIVTVAIGSTLGSTLTSSGVSLAEGVTALALLVALQYIVTWLTSRWPAFDRLVKDRPALLAFRGELLRDALRRERVTAEEVYAAVREQGLASLEEVEAVVLQSSSQFAVVKRIEPGEPRSALEDVTADAPRL